MIVYEASSYLINETAFKLSPIPIIVAYIYPYLKRFTCLCHYVLGLNLAFAPLGGWVAVTNSIFFDRIILLPSLAVIFWVAGFDIIYALQDLEFDRKYRLHSIGAHFGKNFALRLSALNHAIFFVSVLFSAVMWSKIAVVGVIVIGLLLLYEHLAVRRGDIDTAFFKVNAIISSILLLTFLLTT